MQMDILLRRKKTCKPVLMVLLWLNKTASGNAILYINPHTTFYFRPEIQMSRGRAECLWSCNLGQFFIYQGFNENCGWMHTSTNVDVAVCMRKKLLLK
jgi:acyl-homoserine lactone acylase PvdQ